MSDGRRRKRRRSLLLLGLLAVLAAAAAVRLPAWSRGMVQARLATFFQRPVSIGALRYDLLPRPRLTLEDLRVAGPTAQAPAFLEARRLVLVPRLRPLWERRALLGRLHATGLRLSIRAYRDGGHDLPAFDLGGAGGREVRVDRLVVEDSELFVNDQRVPLDVSWHGVSARMFGSRKVLTGRVAIDRGDLRFGGADPLALSLEAELRLQGPHLEVKGAHVRAPRTDVLADGSVDWSGRLEGHFTVKGEVDLGVMDRHVTRTGLGLEGHGRAEGELELGGGGLSFRGQVSGRDGAFQGVAVPVFAGGLAWDEAGLHLRDLDLETLGGAATLQVDLPPGQGRAALEAQFAGLDAEALAGFVFGVGPAGLGAAATGEAALSWPRGRIRDLNGTVALDLEASNDGRTPLWGQLAWTAQEGAQSLERADLRTPFAQARLSGGIGRDLTADLAVDGEVTDLAAGDALLVRLRRALGAGDPQPVEVSGGGRYQGRWRGTLVDPVFEGRFQGTELGYHGVTWGRAEWAGTLTGHDVSAHSLVLRRQESELWLDGSSQTGDFGRQDGVDLRLRLVRWPAADLLRVLEWDLDFQGDVTGEAEVRGRRSAPVGALRIASASGRYHGVPFEDLELDSRLRGAATEIRRGQARVGGGDVRFLGWRRDDGVYDLQADLTEVEVSALTDGRAGGVPWSGPLSGRVVVQGARERPRLRARFSSPRLTLAGETLGAADATLDGSGDGQVRIEGACRSEQTELVLSGSVAVAPPYLAALLLKAPRADLRPLLRAALPELPDDIGGRLAGEARIRGALQRPGELNGEVAISTLALELPDYPVRSRAPLRAALREGRLELGEARLSGEGTDLAVAGSVSLSGAEPLQLTLDGAADLRVVSLLVPELRGRGAARLGVRVSGSLREPRLDGTLKVEGATLRARGFPHGIEDVRGEARFTEGGAEFSGVRATVGGGPVEASGEAAYERGRLRSFDVRARGHGLALRYPEGLRSQVDADLRLFGDADNQWLTGRVDVRQAVWTRRYDVASELLAESRPTPTGSASGGSLRLDIKVSAPGTVRVDNNLAQLTARADVALQGTSQAPVVLGRAEVEKGRVFFQGNTYLIRRGAIEFANPRRIDPLFDIEAETRVRSYRITLRMNGTLERVYPALSADPYLSTVQILGLLAGADEATVDSFSTAAARDLAQTRLAAAGAATLAAGRLSEEVGLERGAARLGLDRFSIDPSLVRGNVSDPTARVTLGKRVTQDMNILYSLDLRGTEERLVSVEYTLSDRLSVLMTQVEPGGFGFDLRIRQSR